MKADTARNKRQLQVGRASLICIRRAFVKFALNTDRGDTDFTHTFKTVLHYCLVIIHPTFLPIILCVCVCVCVCVSVETWDCGDSLFDIRLNDQLNNLNRAAPRGRVI